MTKFEIEGKMDFVHLFEPRRSLSVSRQSSENFTPKFGLMISEMSEFKLIDGNDDFENIEMRHACEFSDIHSADIHGISASTKRRPPVIGLNSNVFAMCKRWNISPDRFLVGHRGPVRHQRIQGIALATEPNITRPRGSSHRG